MATTNKGLFWSVVAPWVRWPLHSPTRLVTVLAAALLVVFGISQISSDPSAEPTSAPSTSQLPTSTGSSSPAGSSTSSPTSPLETSTSAPSVPPAETPASSSPVTAPDPAAPAAPPEAQQAAEGFVTAWARPTLPKEQWYAGVRGFLAPAMETSLKYTAPAQIPASRRTGPATLLQLMPSPKAPIAAGFSVPTDAGPVRVDLMLTKERWLVTSITPASATVPGD